MHQPNQYLEPVKAIARAAARAILEVYDSDFEVEHKADASPLTQADLAAHHVIVEGLGALTPEVPVLSEESADIPFDTRQSWSAYWLVDPLDGTKEFVKRNGEFTVNIALVKNHRPVLGVVVVPVTGRCYAGVVGHGAGIEHDAQSRSVPISTRGLGSDRVVVAGSRSHRDARSNAFIEALGESFAHVDVASMGSSLKFCRLAEGEVDVYPRFGPTSEWDTAAAQAVVEAAGGQVVDVDLEPLRYNTKDSLLNPHFLVFGDPNGPWASVLKRSAAD